MLRSTVPARGGAGACRGRGGRGAGGRAEPIEFSGEEDNEGEDAEEDIEGGDVGFHHFAGDDEGEEFEDGVEVVGEHGPGEFDADDHEEDAVNEFVEGFGVLPVEGPEEFDAFPAEDGDADDDERGKDPLDEGGGLPAPLDESFVHGVTIRREMWFVMGFESGFDKGRGRGMFRA